MPQIRPFRLRNFAQVLCGLFSCSLSLFAGPAEDEEALRKIDSLSSCLQTFQTILQEKMQKPSPSFVDHSVPEFDSFLVSLANWQKNASDLKTVSWDLYPKFVRTYALLGGFSVEIDEQFHLQGFKQGIVEQELNTRLLELFQRSKKIPFLVEDCDPNYFASGLNAEVQETLNQQHAYLLLEDPQKELLKAVLESMKEPVSACLGSAWRVLTIRSWKTTSQAEEYGPTSWHSDGMPSSVYKIMYYPKGADREQGTVELQLLEGSHVLEGPSGTWMLFKNSEVIHRGIKPQLGERLAIEITIAPSLEYDLQPLCMGLNARHPHLPWQKPAFSEVSTYSSTQVQGVNIGGGPHWSYTGWVNLEEVPSSSNPNPFHLSPNCRFPFVENSVQTIYSSHALEHLNLSTVYRVLSESFRILKEKGDLILKIPDYDQALDCWRRQEGHFFGPGWNIESVTPTWGTKGIYDCLDYRAAMIFCSFFNDAYGNPFGAGKNTSHQSYFGPPVLEIGFLRDLIQTHTPSQIAQALRLAIQKTESNFHFCHQSAWSRVELQNLLQEFDFEVVSFDPIVIRETFGEIPGMHQMPHHSTYCWAKKRMQ